VKPVFVIQEELPVASEARIFPRAGAVVSLIEGAVIAPVAKAPVMLAVVLTVKPPVIATPALQVRRSPMVLLVRVWMPEVVATEAERAEALPVSLEMAERSESEAETVPVVEVRPVRGLAMIEALRVLLASFPMADLMVSVATTIPPAEVE
jgi:hypothetical protein